MSYTRCRREAYRGTITGEIAPFWPDQHGCSVHQVVLPDGRPSRLRVPSFQGRSLWMPRVWRGTLTYARLRDLGLRRSDGERVHRWRMELVRRSRGGRTRRLVGGPGATFDTSIGAGRPIEQGGGVTSVAVRGSRVLYTWAFPSGRCRVVPRDSISYDRSVYLEQGTERRRLRRGCDYGRSGAAGSASLGPSGPTWLRTWQRRRPTGSPPRACSTCIGAAPACFAPPSSVLARRSRGHRHRRAIGPAGNSSLRPDQAGEAPTAVVAKTRARRVDVGTGRTRTALRRASSAGPSAGRRPARRRPARRRR